MSIEVTDEVKDYLAKDGYNEAYGARPLRRVIQNSVEDALSEELLKGDIKLGDKVEMYMNEGKFAFRKKED